MTTNTTTSPTATIATAMETATNPNSTAAAAAAPAAPTPSVWAEKAKERERAAARRKQLELEEQQLLSTSGSAKKLEPLEGATSTASSTIHTTTTTADSPPLLANQEKSEKFNTTNTTATATSKEEHVRRKKESFTAAAAAVGTAASSPPKNRKAAATNVPEETSQKEIKQKTSSLEPSSTLNQNVSSPQSINSNIMSVTINTTKTTPVKSSSKPVPSPSSSSNFPEDLSSTSAASPISEKTSSTSTLFDCVGSGNATSTESNVEISASSVVVEQKNNLPNASSKKREETAPKTPFVWSSLLKAKPVPVESAASLPKPIEIKGEVLVETPLSTETAIVLDERAALDNVQVEMKEENSLLVGEQVTDEVKMSRSSSVSSFQSTSSEIQSTSLAGANSVAAAVGKDEEESCSSASSGSTITEKRIATASTTVLSTTSVMTATPTLMESSRQTSSVPSIAQIMEIQAKEKEEADRMREAEEALEAERLRKQRQQQGQTQATQGKKSKGKKKVLSASPSTTTLPTGSVEISSAATNEGGEAKQEESAPSAAVVSPASPSSPKSPARPRQNSQPHQQQQQYQSGGNSNSLAFGLGISSGGGVKNNNGTGSANNNGGRKPQRTPSTTFNLNLGGGSGRAHTISSSSVMSGGSSSTGGGVGMERAASLNSHGARVYNNNNGNNYKNTGGYNGANSSGGGAAFFNTSANNLTNSSNASGVARQQTQANHKNNNKTTFQKSTRTRSSFSLQDQGRYVGNNGGNGGGAQNNLHRQVQNLQQWVIYQLEYYFSTDNLCKDVYFRSLMAPSTGWVPMGKVLDFPRFRGLLIQCANAVAAMEKQDEERRIRAGQEEATSVATPTTATPSTITDLDVVWATQFVFDTLSQFELASTYAAQATGDVFNSLLELNRELGAVRLRYNYQSWIIPANAIESLIKSVPGIPKFSVGTQVESQQPIEPTVPIVKTSNAAEVTPKVQDEELFQFDESEKWAKKASTQTLKEEQPLLPMMLNDELKSSPINIEKTRAIHDIAPTGSFDGRIDESNSLETPSIAASSL